MGDCFYVVESAAILCYIGISSGRTPPLTKGIVTIALYCKDKKKTLISVYLLLSPSRDVGGGEGESVLCTLKTNDLLT